MNRNSKLIALLVVLPALFAAVAFSPVGTWLTPGIAWISRTLAAHLEQQAQEVGGI